MNSSAAFREEQRERHVFLIWLVAPCRCPGFLITHALLTALPHRHRGARAGPEKFWFAAEGEAAGVMERGESRRHLMICGSRCVTDSFYGRAAISAPARLEAAVQLLRKWLRRFIHMKVFPPKLCRGSRLSGALRESIRATDITTVFLFPCPSPFSFIYLQKPSSSLQRAQDKHKQRKCAVCIGLRERLRSCFSLLWDSVAAIPIINPAAAQPLWSRLKCDVPSDVCAQTVPWPFRFRLNIFD